MAQIAMSKYLSTLSRLSDDDVDEIWSGVSCFIEKQMLERKGVHILGLGTFTFCHQKLNLGNERVLTQRPVFILSEKLCRYYGLQQVKPQAADAPVVPLIFSSVSAGGAHYRSAVKGCVRETLLLLLRAAAAHRPVRHAFPGIGVLSFRQGRVRMMFCPDFISALDGAGKPGSSNRPETSNGRGKERLLRPVTFSGTSAGASLRKEPLTEPKTAPKQTDDDDGQVMELTDLANNSLSSTDRDRPVAISTVKRGPADVSVMCRDHRRAGQELCYVCMQRAQRNRPLFQSDEKTRAESRQRRVLLLHEHQRDLQYFQKEEADRRAQRADSQQVAAFNLGVAEAQRRRKEPSVASSQTHGSYIFAARPCTADRLPQQRRYMQEADRRRETQHEQQRLDKLHLLQLSEEREKRELARKHQKALEPQNELRCSETAPHRPAVDAWPVFGLMDSDPAALSEQRQRAKNISEELLNAADRRRRELMEKRRNEQQREREILQRAQKEMLEERICHYEKLQDLQADCEESWKHSGDLKHRREQEELNFRRFAGQTLTDQLEKYERCSQCKRSTANCGKTNIFRDTDYMPGSRIML